MDKKAHNFEFLARGGPYSNAIEANGFLFLSGMIPSDVEKGIKITDDAAKGAELCLNNINRTLTAMGSSMDKIVKATVFLRDMADFNSVNEIYKTFFHGDPPARTCVAVKELPGGVPIEIEVIALK